MKKLVIVLLIVLLTSCTAPHVKNVVSKLPDGYSRAYLITDNVQTTEIDMEDFIKNFTTDTDFVICIDSLDYLVLRK